MLPKTFLKPGLWWGGSALVVATVRGMALASAVGLIGCYGVAQPSLGSSAGGASASGGEAGGGAGGTREEGRGGAGGIGESGAGGNGETTGGAGGGGGEPGGGAGGNGEATGGTGGEAAGGARADASANDVMSMPDAKPVPPDASPSVDGPPPNMTPPLGNGGAHSSGGPFVGPAVTPDCAGDPTAGWTEYIDTFNVEKPYDLAESARFTWVGGIWTYWVLPSDKAHQPGNSTAPRTEARFSNFTNSKMHMWAADIKLDRTLNHTAIMQVHTTTTGAGPVYIRVDDGNLHPLNGAVFATNLYEKWFNMKVALDPGSRVATIWINNCQKVKGVIGVAGNGIDYFKNGTYTCTGSLCRAQFKNLHLYTK